LRGAGARFVRDVATRCRGAIEFLTCAGGAHGLSLIVYRNQQEIDLTELGTRADNDSVFLLYSLFFSASANERDT
jgi:hypothetical protein